MKRGIHLLRRAYRARLPGHNYSLKEVTMELKKLGLCLAIAASVLLPGGATLKASEITDLYMKAMEKNDRAALTGIVKYKKDAIPGEIQGLIDKAQLPETTAEEKKPLFYIAEHMAIRYKDVTGDFAPLIEVKKRAFDARLSAPVTPELTEGARIIDIPKAADGVKNLFEPDNIVIKQGETVRWTNSDDIAHVFATLSAISAGKFAVSSIPPGESWEHKFEKPGEYFYICFIHQSMVGKITVEDAASAEAEAEVKAEAEAEVEADSEVEADAEAEAETEAVEAPTAPVLAAPASDETNAPEEPAALTPPENFSAE